MSRLIYPIFILGAVAIGCADSSTRSTPNLAENANRAISNAEKAIKNANTAAGPQPRISDNDVAKVKYLDSAAEYLGELGQSDKAMLQEFVKDDRTLISIVDALKTAVKAEQSGYDNVGKAPKDCAAIRDKLAEIHKDHVRAFTSYTKTFAGRNLDEMSDSIDLGNGILLGTVGEMNNALDMIHDTMPKK